MTVWMLARSGQHGQLHLGMIGAAIEANFGAPQPKQHSIWNFDAVELHFEDDRLWLIHCEFGSPPQPLALASRALGLSPEGFEWPTNEAVVIEMAKAAGLNQRSATWHGAVTFASDSRLSK